MPVAFSKPPWHPKKLCILGRSGSIFAYTSSKEGKTVKFCTPENKALPCRPNLRLSSLNSTDAPPLGGPKFRGDYAHFGRKWSTRCETPCRKRLGVVGVKRYQFRWTKFVCSPMPLESLKQSRGQRVGGIFSPAQLGNMPGKG